MSKELERLEQLCADLLASLESNETFVLWRNTSEAVAKTKAQMALTAAEEPPALVFQSTKAADKAYDIIATRNHPIQTKQLYELLVAAGVSFQGATPLGNLASQLSKSKRLVSVQIGPSGRDHKAWWLSDKPLPPAYEAYEKGPVAQTTGPSRTNGAAHDSA